MQVNTILHSIEQQIEVLKSEKGKPVDPVQTQKIEQILETQFTELEKTISNDASVDKKVIAKTLTTLDRELQRNSFISAEKIKSLRTEISTIKNTLDHSYQPADVRLAMILDIDSPDHNGAVFRGLINCIDSKVPFITTPILLGVTLIDTPNGRDSLFENIQTEILKHQNEWDILQQEDSKTGKQLLVFIPKNMKPELSLEDKIKFMDLNPDVLHKITPQEALAGPQDVIQFQSLPNLFAANPTHSKLIFLNGHGMPHASGGLNREHFGQFMDLIKAQKCQGLTVLSCYSGGETTLDFTPQKTKDETGSEPVYSQTVSFPIIVRSPGDYTSLAGSAAESDLNPHFDVMDMALKESGGASRKKFTEAMIKAEKGMDKSSRNLVQVYFPTSADSPGGFAPLNEIEGSYSLTYPELRARQLEAQGKPIEIKNASSVLLYPQVFDVALQIEGPPPPLLSATPGTSHHYINNLLVKGSTLSEFLVSQRNFYGPSSLEFSKAFFIERLECADGVYEGVVIDCDSTGKVTCFYQKEGKFEKNEENKTTELTKTAYSMMTCDILEESTPKEKAVRHTTGGQEDRLDVERHVLNEQFIKIPHFFNPKEIPQKSEEELLNAYHSLSESEKAILVFDLIKYKRNSIVEKLVREDILDPNIKSIDGDPLLHIAISEKDEALFKTLIEKGADPNCQDDIIGHPPLVIALKNRNQACFDTLLADPRLNINLLNKEGMPPVIFFAFLPEALDSMLKAGANIHMPCGTDLKQTVLSLACRYPFTNDFRKKILEKGTSPNRGTPSPIESAAIHGDVELMDLLLKAGANPWLQQYDGNLPIHNILMKAPRSIIMKLMEMPEANFNATNSKGENPLDIAIARQDLGLVEELLKRGAHLGLDNYSRSYLRTTISRLINMDNLPLLKQLIESHKNLTPNFEASLFKPLQYELMELEPYFKEGIFADLNTPFPELMNRSFFGVICAGSVQGFTNIPLIETCLSLNANVNQNSAYFFEEVPLIELVLRNRNKELADLFLKHGLDKTTYQQTIEKLSNDNFMKEWLEENGYL